MTQTERAILETLQQLEARAGSRSRPGSGPGLLELFARLDALAGTLPPETPPDLVHYLRRKSYEKARLWLEGRDAENARGACGH